MASHRDSAPAPIYDAIEAARLYQALYWVARTAAVPTPLCDVIHVTAAGWSGIPAIIHKALYGTPLLLTEHGVYVREAYLASVREAAARPGHGHISPRLALGMTRAVYAAADVIAPVTEANAEWERGLGVDPSKIRVIPNGIDPPNEQTAPPNIKKVIAMGRLDPLKDVQTMLLVANEVTRRLPEARFECYGPPTLGQEMYADACAVMHRQLGLGDRFRFMGGTGDPKGAIRSGDLVLMTSISEAMPMTLLEAMGAGPADRRDERRWCPVRHPWVRADRASGRCPRAGHGCCHPALQSRPRGATWPARVRASSSKLHAVALPWRLRSADP